ncbi:MAG TPA: hypothetical protein VK684_11755 [Edaphobacter sp.]|nr:hypothetical protein [Edaphobacter sp.]
MQVTTLVAPGPAGLCIKAFGKAWAFFIDAVSFLFIIGALWHLPDEFGAEAKYGNHGETNKRWTEEQQAYVIQHQFAMLRKIPNLRGLTPWTLIDFRSTTRNIPKLQDGFNRKGLISEKGEKKQAFELFQKAYKEHSLGKPE